jgi:hypothetical protein
MASLRSVLDDMAPGTTVAMLLTGPGRGPVNPADRLWSKSLTEMAARFVIPIEPIFRANDESLVQVMPPAPVTGPVAPGNHPSRSANGAIRIPNAGA